MRNGQTMMMKVGIRILRGPLRTADLRGPVNFYSFLEIRILRGPLIQGPNLNSFLFVIVSLIIFQTSHVQDTIFKSIKILNNFSKSKDILNVFDLKKILFQSMILDGLNFYIFLMKSQKCQGPKYIF